MQPGPERGRAVRSKAGRAPAQPWMARSGLGGQTCPSQTFHNCREDVVCLLVVVLVLDYSGAMEYFEIKDEFIELNKLLKVLGVFSTGGEANVAITEGEVMVDGSVETRKRNKIRPGMVVTARGRDYGVKSGANAS